MSIFKTDIPLIRYEIHQSYIQANGYQGEVWFVWDKISRKQVGPSRGPMPSDLDVEKRNNDWKAQIEEFVWIRECKYFSYIHRFPSYFHNLKISELSQNPLVKQINSLQTTRAKLIYDVRVDLTEYLDVKLKILEFNRLAEEETALRNEIGLPIVNRLTHLNEYYIALGEFEKWFKYLGNGRNTNGTVNPIV